ncbi:hypothetical protein [Nonomuraea longicatena]|uniref:Uncharacterized protein n=1 Tax=Nonomuraea longicatena TaxID=83682 RepID=A0ABN1NXG5_9ACTN
MLITPEFIAQNSPATYDPVRGQFVRDYLGDTRFKIAANKFHVFDLSTELSSCDELYFAFTAVDGTGAVTTTLSPVFESLYRGSERQFSNLVLWQGTANKGGVVVSVTVMVEDEGAYYDQLKNNLDQIREQIYKQMLTDPHDVKGTLANIAFDAAGVSFPPWAQALSAGILAFAEAFIKWSADDFVGTHTYVFTEDFFWIYKATWPSNLGGASGRIDGADQGEAELELSLAVGMA